ncbi:MAG: hypothetical protein R3E94_15600 [Burkholderiaceae bacterium]
MFEIAFDQAAGLRTAIPVVPARVLPVAATAQPARGYELLCDLATRLSSHEQAVVIVDASAREAERRQGADGQHLGLLHVLDDGGISGLGQAPGLAEWLVLPGARGLQSLVTTTASAGPAVALSRLLVPFAAGALVLLYAPAPSLSGLLGGLGAQVLVPLVDQPQASIDAYTSVKWLQGAGLRPSLVPVADPLAPGQDGLRRLQDTVLDCARRHLSLELDCWPTEAWTHRAMEMALAAPHHPYSWFTQGESSRATRTPHRRVHAHFSWS